MLFKHNFFLHINYIMDYISYTQLYTFCRELYFITNKRQEFEKILQRKRLRLYHSKHYKKQ